MAATAQTSTSADQKLIVLSMAYLNSDRLDEYLKNNFGEEYSVKIMRGQYYISTNKALTSQELSEIKNLKRTIRASGSKAKDIEEKKAPAELDFQTNNPRPSSRSLSEKVESEPLTSSENKTTCTQNGSKGVEPDTLKPRAGAQRQRSSPNVSESKVLAALLKGLTGVAAMARFKLHVPRAQKPED